MRNRAPLGLPRRERGFILFIVLIVLVAMMLAGTALMRSVDTGTSIAGNFAFKQATVAAVDAGIAQAFAGTFTRFSGATTGTTVANQYYATMQTLGSDGLPSVVTWSAAPYLDLGTTNGNRVRYVVERMCAPNAAGTPPTFDFEITQFCVTEPDDAPPCVRLPCPPWTGNRKVNYRVSLRVEGPRNTVTTAQAVIAF
jgi:type IV pilus assembly protein PilX